MIVYHNSNHLFERPNMEMIETNITGHANGLLGLWFSTSNSWQEHFGKYAYEIDIPESFVMKEIGISEFVKLCNNEADYSSIRDSLIKDGYDVLGVIENNGNIEMGIILNLDINVKRINRELSEQES